MTAEPIALPRRVAAPRIIAAACGGTIVEWYDFYIYGNLAVFFGAQFFPSGNESVAILLSLATMGIGFAVRPLGGLVFGAISDYVGRKYTFALTLIVMGLATTCIGVLPTYSQIGIAAPIALVFIRLVQGFSAGGEIGSAATYVVENAPEERRAFYSSWLSTMAPGGIAISLVVIIVCRNLLGDATFRDWGWRVPFLLSAGLVALSIYFRLRLRESPIFAALKEQGRLSRRPIRETFLDRKNLRMVILVAFGVTTGQAALGATSLIYATQFMQTVLKVDLSLASILSAVALALSVPFFVVFGWLSDRIGRRKVMLTGMILAILLYVPIYIGMKAAASAANPVALCFLLWLQLLFTTMVNGAQGAYLAECFPARIRTTSTGTIFNVANGFVAGFLPFAAFWLTSTTGNPYMGLAYPIFFAVVAVAVNLAFLSETYKTKIWDEVTQADT